MQPQKSPAAPLRPHTPASVARPGAVRPGVSARPAPGRSPGKGPARPAPGAARPKPLADEAPEVPRAPEGTDRIRTRRPRTGLNAAPAPAAAAALAAPAAALAAPAAVAERALVPARGPSLADQLGSRAYVAQYDAAYDLAIEPNKTCFFDTINKVKALTVAGPISLCVDENLARARGYEPEDLQAVAEIAWHYLMSGGLKLALTLYEGLAAVAPEEPYFALALGLVHDRLNDPAQAHACYERAARLDPSDGRPDVNRAELFLEASDRAKALQLMARGAEKARRRGDEALANKAEALLAHVAARR
jgi:tetratricopeptide (TPR) repeat protein